MSDLTHLPHGLEVVESPWSQQRVIPLTEPLYKSLPGPTPSTHLPHGGSSMSDLTHLPHGGSSMSDLTHLPHGLEVVESPWSQQGMVPLTEPLYKGLHGPTPSTHLPHGGSLLSDLTHLPHGGSLLSGPTPSTHLPHGGSLLSGPTPSTHLPHSLEVVESPWSEQRVVPLTEPLYKGLPGPTPSTHLPHGGSLLSDLTHLPHGGSLLSDLTHLPHGGSLLSDLTHLPHGGSLMSDLTHLPHSLEVVESPRSQQGMVPLTEPLYKGLPGPTPSTHLPHGGSLLSDLTHPPHGGSSMSDLTHPPHGGSSMSDLTHLPHGLEVVESPGSQQRMVPLTEPLYKGLLLLSSLLHLLSPRLPLSLLLLLSQLVQQVARVVRRQNLTPTGP